MASSSTPEYSALRRRVADLSYPLLRWLDRRPKWLLTVVVTALLVVGLIAPQPWGPICLGVVVVLLGWLAYLSWPEGDNGRRGVRVVMVGLAVGALVLRLFE